MQFSIKSIAVASLTAMSLLTTSAFAADGLNGTRWKTIDDKTGKPKAIVEFNKQTNGTFNGTIIETLDPANKNGCMSCAGDLKGKKLEGVTIVHGLKEKSSNQYEGGKILDPKNGSTYSFKAQIANNGKVLKGRGYIGVAFAGRDQTWYRVN